MFQGRLPRSHTSMPFPLSSDGIIYCILKSLPDFATFRSTILVSKSFNGVFRKHPDSILISVAANQIGPEVLSCAIRLEDYLNNDLPSRVTYVETFPLEKDYSNIKVPVVTSYIRRLIRNSNVVRELELFFSIRYVLLLIVPKDVLIDVGK